MIVHREKIHPGMHAAIVDPDLFEAAQAKLDANARRHAARCNHVARAPLTGRIFDRDGQPMSPTFSYGNGGRLYRYYVSSPLQRGQRRAENDDTIRRVSATAVETMLAGISMRILPTHASDPPSCLARVEIRSRSVQLLMPIHHLPLVRDRIADGEKIEVDPADPSLLRLTLPIRMQLRGGRRSIEAGANPATKPDPVLIKALRAAYAMVGRDASGLPVLDAAPDSPYRRRLVRLTFLAPDLQRAILERRQPPSLTLGQIMEERLPPLWSEQAKTLGFCRAD